VVVVDRLSLFRENLRKYAKNLRKSTEISRWFAEKFGKYAEKVRSMLKI